MCGALNYLRIKGILEFDFWGIFVRKYVIFFIVNEIVCVLSLVWSD